MNDWCIQHHKASGLTDACLKSKHTTVSVQEEILKYLKKWIPLRRTAMLAGNSVHADRVFLAKEMPEIVDWLHYRSLRYASLHLLLCTV